MLEVVLHAFFEFAHGFFEFGGAFGEAFFFDEGVLGVLFAGGGVFGAFGLREVGVDRVEDVGAEGEGEAFLEVGGIVEVRSEEHEADIGFGSGDGEGEKLGVLVRTNFLHEFGEASFGFALLGLGQGCPLTVVDLVVQVYHVPTFGRHEGRRVFRHVSESGIELGGSHAGFDEGFVLVVTRFSERGFDDL